MLKRSALSWPSALIVLSVVGPEAVAQANYEREVQGHLVQVSDMLVDRGYHRDRIHTGSLGDGQEEDVWLTLSGGADYSIVGVCDDRCADLDLFLYDELDGELDSDASMDDVPVVQGSTGFPGEYRVRVRMYSCDDPPCQYAFGVFRNGEMTGGLSNNRGGGAVANQVRRAVLRAYDDNLSDHGFEPTGIRFTGTLDESATADRWIRLVQGHSYAILGVCDEACDDLDLFLYDERGAEIDIDVAVDATPIVEVRPRITGDYRVRTRMYSCSVDPCYYGVSVYRR